MTGVISGTGSYVPAHTLDNQTIAQMVETSDQWIRERTGVERRHIVREETTVMMAAEAGRRALQDAGMEPEQIDMILVATISSNVILPCTACEVQRILGADRAVCFDLNAACSGFIFAYQTALCYLSSGMYQNILIIGSESLSRMTNWEDRGTCILFGDGAGAVVVTACEGQMYVSAAHSCGRLGNALTCAKKKAESHQRDGRCSFRETGLRSMESGYIQMDGREVFSFAVKRVPEAIEEVLTANHLRVEDIDYFILHQANRRIIESVAKRLAIEMEKFPMNLQEYGNTSSASIPILLDELNKKGILQPGQKIVMAGFGAGLSWGASLLDWKRENR